MLQKAYSSLRLGLKCTLPEVVWVGHGLFIPALVYLPSMFLIEFIWHTWNPRVLLFKTCLGATEAERDRLRSK